MPSKALVAIMLTVATTLGPGDISIDNRDS